MTAAGHNGQLKSIVERIEALEASKADIAADISDVYKEAEGNGFDKKALKALIRERKQDAHKRAELEEILDVYRNALGMLSDLPLGQSAIQRATA